MQEGKPGCVPPICQWRLSLKHRTGGQWVWGGVILQLNMQLCKISIYYFETKKTLQKENERKPLGALPFQGLTMTGWEKLDLRDEFLGVHAVGVFNQPDALVQALTRGKAFALLRLRFSGPVDMFAFELTLGSADFYKAR